MRKLSVLTFNTLGIPFLTTHQYRNYLSISRHLLSRFHYLAETLNASDIDVLMLQEVHLYSLLRYLKRTLTKYPHVHYKRFLYGPKGGIVTFSRHPLEDSDYVNYSSRGTFRNKTFITQITRNGILISKLSNTSISLINTYITGNFSHEWDKENKYTTIQKRQLSELSSVIHTTHNEGSVCIIGGDFNISPKSPLFKPFLLKNHLVDVFSGATTSTHHTEFSPTSSSTTRLDHIFATTSMMNTYSATTKELFTKKVLLKNGKESFISDHVALNASFRLKSA